MSDSDPTARVRIIPAEGDLKVQVALKDGRTTSRLVRDPEALLPTLEALLTLPTLPSPANDRGTAVVDVHEPRDFAPRAPPNQEARIDFELGGGVGARSAGPGVYLSASPSAFAQARFGDWLPGLAMRWETLLRFTGPGSDGLEADALALALTLARRIPTRFGRIDLGVSPRLVSQSLTYLLAGLETSATSTDIRAGLFARIGFGHRVFRLMVEADGEVSPTQLRREIHIIPGSPRLPGWSAGLSVGVAWGAP
jgi:hypothetical protein